MNKLITHVYKINLKYIISFFSYQNKNITFGGCLTRFEVTPEGSTGKTGTGELATIEFFLFVGGNNSAGRILGIAYFSRAL